MRGLQSRGSLGDKENYSQNHRSESPLSGSFLLIGSASKDRVDLLFA